MKIVVTGGAGFIGSHIAAYLASRGYKVLAVDSLERASNLQRLKEADVPLIKADLRFSDLPEADAIVHVAAYISVEESWEKPYEYLWNNAAVTAKVAKYAAERRIHVVYLSSAAVYGNPLYTPIDENHPTQPLSPYGLSKLAGEQIIFMYPGLKYTIARLFNVYGPGQTSPYAGVITRFLERARAKQPPVIYGDGEQTRDFIYVEDVARFVETALEKNAQGIYNVGTGKATSIKHLALLVMKLAGIEGEPIYAPPRPGDIRHSIADIRRAKALGWEPTVDIDHGIKILLLQYYHSVLN
ncbi:MAG: NAD-dependent epimerase/dehydratase family protein [Pyrobaculum sp.]